MARVESRIEIAAPLERVAAFFVPQRMPYWYGAEMDAEFEVQSGEADFRAGQKVRIRGRLLRKEVTLTAVVMAFEMARVLEWKFRDEYGVRGMQRWELERTEAGTRVTAVDEAELPAGGRLVRLADKFWMRPSIARRAKLHLQKLKRICERA